MTNCHLSGAMLDIIRGAKSSNEPPSDKTGTELWQKSLSRKGMVMNMHKTCKECPFFKLSTWSDLQWLKIFIYAYIF